MHLLIKIALLLSKLQQVINLINAILADQLVVFKIAVIINQLKRIDILNHLFYYFLEDEDNDYEENSSLTSREEKRRLSHTAAEQKRRNAIKVNIINITK